MLPSPRLSYRARDSPRRSSVGVGCGWKAAWLPLGCSSPAILTSFAQAGDTHHEFTAWRQAHFKTLSARCGSDLHRDEYFQHAIDALRIETLIHALQIRSR